MEFPSEALLNFFLRLSQVKFEDRGCKSGPNLALHVGRYHVTWNAQCTQIQQLVKINDLWSRLNFVKNPKWSTLRGTILDCADGQTLYNKIQ